MDAEARPTDRPPEAFGGVLRRERLAAGLTQEALAERAGLGVRTVQGLEEGEARPREATVRCLAQALALTGAPRVRFEAAAQPASRRPARALRLVPLLAPAGVPPGRGQGARPTNLPLPRTSFVGREDEVAALTRRLTPAGAGPRLVTLTGAGGCGKTRLALELAAGLRDSAGPPDGGPYPDGVWLVDLAPLADGALVPTAALAAVGGHEGPGRPPLAALVAHLRPRAVLLVLDNCEHLLDACARLADALLGACPRVRLLATSREPLSVAGEVAWPVPPLPVPARLAPGTAAPAPPPDTAALKRYAGVRLFADRATAARPAFALDAGNAAAVAEVCRRLDGLPLALELAAARVRVLPPRQLLVRLDDRFRLLTGGGRTAPPRQQTLRATVEWSYALLDDAERQLFGRLAVFAGGFSLEAAEAVGTAPGDGLEPAGVLDQLTRLVDQSLVVAEAAADGTARFRLLETLRQYAQERLAAGGGSAAARDRHAAYYLALAEASRPPFAEHHDRAWLARLEREHDNLRAALAWTQPGGGAPGEPETGPRLAGALWRFWWQRGHFAEGLGWLERMLRVPAGPAVRATALGGAGVLAFFHGDLTRAAAHYEASLALARASGDRRHAGWTLHRLGRVTQELGDSARAAALGEESVAVLRELGEPLGLIAALIGAGITAQLRGDAARAAALCGEAVAMVRDGGDRKSLATALRVVGSAAGDRGDGAGATTRLDEALGLFRGLEDRWGVTTVLQELMVLAQRRGDAAAAAALGHACLRLLRELGTRLGAADCYERLAWVAHARGQPEQAARLLGAAETVRNITSAPLAPVRRADHDGVVAAVRDALGEAALATAWAEGQAMSPEQAVVYALEDAPDAV
jgi:non-specific serine/threonine protein kinase